MLYDALVSGVVGWLIAAVGTAVSRRSADAVLGSTEERALRDALLGSVTAVVAQVPADAREDLAEALRERAEIPPLDTVGGAGPIEIFAGLIDSLLAPLALPGQTLANLRIDVSWVRDALLEALMTAIRRTAVTSGNLTDLAQLIGIERLEIAQRRITQILLDQPRPSATVNTLPRSVLHFTGREGALQQLRSAASRSKANDVVTIQAIEGMAGIGKTELAIRAANLLAADYPDAQLYVDLQGFTLGLSPIPPLKALESLLVALHTPPEQILPDLEQRAAQWRSQLFGKRAIVVLDNAANVAQVTPLIPGTPGCFVIITSRRSLAEIEDVDLLRLDVLDESAAAELFIRVLGGAIAAEPDDIQSVVRLCGFLPLAIRLAAGRLRRRPQFGVTTLVRDLTDTRRRLMTLRTGNREVRAAFELSYTALDPGAREAFRLLGLHPGPDVTAEAAAALMGTSSEEAEEQLEELLAQSLLQETTDHRFILHDLIREYASERARAEESASQCAAAEGRLFDFFLTKAAVVNQNISEASEINGPAGMSWARHWLEAERTNIVAAVRLAEENADRFAVDVAQMLGNHLLNLGFTDDAGLIFRAAMHVGSVLSDPEAQALGLLGWGKVLRFIGSYDEARDRLSQAYDISEERGSKSIAADTLYELGEIERAAGNYAQALAHYQLSQRICAEMGGLRGEANTLRGIAEVMQALGNLDGARDSYMRSHTLCVRDEYRQGQAFALLGLGEVERTAGNLAMSKVHYEVATTLCLDTGDRRGQANAAYGLGEVNRAMGEHVAALQHFTDAHAIAVELGNRRGQAYTLQGMGDSEQATGDDNSAKKHLAEARTICHAIGDRPGEARALIALGEIAGKSGDTGSSVSFWRDASIILRSAGLGQRADEVDNLISRYGDRRG